MTALRERMTEDLILRGLSLNTQAAYLRAVTQLAGFYRRPLEGRFSPRDVRTLLSIGADCKTNFSRSPAIVQSGVCPRVG